jgi:acetoin utilization deacetylase AcuC-like enzyme
MLREALQADGVFDFHPAPLAVPGDIELVHDPAYVAAFLEGTLPRDQVRRIGFPWSEGLVRRTLASVGGTLAAAGLALETGAGATLAGGTHHAFRDYGSGYCVFNDIAVAIRALQMRSRIQRAAVVDLDVHQGDGTAVLFSGDRNVLTLSIHGRNNFPFRKQASDIDIELPDSTGDQTYLEALAAALSRVWEFAPDIVFFQSGVDTLAADRLGRLALTLAGLARRDAALIGETRRRRIPLVITLGGGYAEPIEETVEAHAQTFRLLRAHHATPA